MSTVTFQHGVQPSAAWLGWQDNRLDSISNGKDQNFGAHPNGLAGSIEIDREVREVTRWDLSAIDAGRVCVSASLLYYHLGTWAVQTGDVTVDVYEIAAANAGWVEGTENGVPQAGSSCWNKQVYNTVDWAGSAGCTTSVTDFLADSWGSQVFPDGSDGWRTITLNPTGCARLAAMFGSASPAGVILVGTPVATAGRIALWNSRDNIDDTSLRPKLIIEHEAGGGIPAGVLAALMDED